MTGGFAALPLAEDGGAHDDGNHLTGVSKILGPRWLQLPAITIGLLGVQVLWSVEMSYGAWSFKCISSPRVDLYYAIGTPYLISLVSVDRSEI